MFRPPPLHPRGGPPRNNNSQQSPGTTAGPTFVPSAFPIHGRGRGGFHAPFHGGPSYLMFPPSGRATSVRPPPPPGSPPVDNPPPPPPPPSDGNFRSVPKFAPLPHPPMPNDPEMLKNIEILSSFVVKNGPQFESMARAKQAGDPKFAFLFGGERGSDAAFGYDFYNWKKEHLMFERTKTSPADQQPALEPSLQGRNGRPVLGGMSLDAPDSPAGSDMDMEDDFALPDPTNEKHSNLHETPAVTSVAVGRKWGPLHTPSERRLQVSSSAPEWRPDVSSSSFEARPALPLSASHKAGHESVESNVVSPVDLDSTQQSGTRLAAEIKSNAYGGKTPRASDTSRVQRETTLLHVPKRRDTRRRTGFDRPCMEDVSPQSSPVRTQPQRESLPALDQYLKGTPGNGHQEDLSKPSRWGPEPSLEGRGSGFLSTEANKGSSKLDTFTQKEGESSFLKDRLWSPDVAAIPLRSHYDDKVKGNEKPWLNSGSNQPVDEFGRLLRQEDSDSDLDDDRYGGRKKRRKTMSRSRSRSPGETRFKYRSPEKSPHGWCSRRSQSWSRSPRRNKSNSLTPPREGRWGGEGRDDRRPVEKGGRRVGSRGVAGATLACSDFLKGKCLRGSSCRYSHGDSHGGNGDQGRKWSGGRGLARVQGRTDRGGDEGEWNWGGRSGDDTKHWQSWEPNERSMEEPRETKLVAESKKQEHGVSAGEATKLVKGSFDDPAKPAVEVGQTGNFQGVVSSAQLVTKAFAPSSTSISQSQSSIIPRPICQAGQPIPNMLLPQQPSDFTNSTSETHKLGSLVTPVFQQSPIIVSPTLHSQQVQVYSALTHLQQNSLSETLQPQKPGQPQSLTAVSQINSFISNPLHQQFTSAARNLLPGSSPPLQVLRPPFAAVPVGRPQISFIGSQRPNLAQLAGNNGQGGVLGRPQVGASQQMLQSPVVPSLQQPNARLAWMPGGLGPTTSYPLGPPQPVQQPPESLQQAIESLQQPPQSAQQRMQPLRQPPLQPLPPQVSTAATGVYPYPIPSSYAMPSYSTLSTTDIRASQPPSIQDQYDPLSDSLEPEPPGSADKNGVVSYNHQGSSQDDSAKSVEGEQGRHNPVDVTAPLMTNAGEVVLENVSPGLPGHVEALGRGHRMTGRVSPIPQRQMIMENASPTDVGKPLNAKPFMRPGGPQQRVPMENVSPLDDNPKEAAGEGGKDSVPKTKEDKKKDNDGRVLNLIRKAVAEHVKESLKPTWKGGQITKEAFKIIAKKAVDKVMGALVVTGQIPKTQEKVDSLMKTSKPKIAKLVQGYVDKYSKP